MFCANAWLAEVHAAGGYSEPPPEPDIPIDYVRKPRRCPTPLANLVISPAQSTRTSFARPKKPRAAPSEEELPSEKRQRTRNASAPAMSQTSQSPTRRSSSRAGTLGKARIAMNEAPVVEQSWLATQDVVDANAAPRPTRQKAAAPPATPTLDLYTRPAPVLTPSVSDKYVDEDVENPEGAEVESTHASTISKRSRSPTRRMVDLQIAKKPVVPKTATSSKDVPRDVGTLYREIQALARRSKGVIPLGIEPEVTQDSNGDLDDLEDYVAETRNGKTPEQLMDEFKAMREIRNGTLSCKTKHLHEPSWNELVHSQMLKQAVLGRPGFSYYNITTARVVKELVPSNEYGELLKSKMIDFAVTLGPPLIPRSYIINRLAASPRKLQRTTNPSDYSPLCFEPIVLSIETKSPEGGNENGEVQLSVWAMAFFNRLRQLIQDPVPMTLPLVLIADARWRLYFASDLANEIHLIDAVDIGTTADIIGCYTILEALRVMFTWVEETFAPWFLDGMKPE